MCVFVLFQLLKVGQLFSFQGGGDNVDQRNCNNYNYFN